MNFSFAVVVETMLIVFEVVPRTLLLSLLILVIGIVFGALLAYVQRLNIPVVKQIITVFLSYIRGVPLIVHLFIMRYSLPDFTATIMSMFGLTLEPGDFPNIMLVIVTYSLLEMATESQYIRGALQSVDRSQIDAARSIGMTATQVNRRIVIPQALTVAVPLFLNAFLKIIKALSLAFTVGVVDILTQARYAAALSYRYLESYVAAALVYWIVCGILSVIFGQIEKRLSFER